MNKLSYLSMTTILFICTYSYSSNDKIALQSEISIPFYTFYYLNQNNTKLIEYNKPPCLIGIGYKLGKTIRIDLLGGIVYHSGIQSDTEINQDYNITLETGVSFKIKKGEKTNLGIPIRFGLSVFKEEAFYSNVTWVGSGRYYNALMPYLFLGAEPAFKLKKSFEIYSNFGIKTLIMPSKKYHDGNNLKDFKNSGILLLFEGICIGLRYYL
jgi:hypothetical protein